MEESTKDQTSKADPHDQIALTKEQGDDDQPVPTKHARQETYYITVARALLDADRAKEWLIFLKRLNGPLKRSVELFKEYSLAESTTFPETVLISENPSPSDDRILAAKQRIQSAHLFIHQTRLDGYPPVPDIPPSAFYGLNDEKLPLWWRIKFALFDGQWFATRNHFAHSFGIPPEARGTTGYPRIWDDIRIFQWVHDKYIYLEPAVRQLVEKLEAAINDKEHWTTSRADHIRLDLEHIKYRQDTEEADPIWIEYLRKREEDFEKTIRENEEIKKANAYKNYTEVLLSEVELAQAAGWGSPTQSELAEGQTLEDVTDAMIEAVTKRLKVVVDDAVRAAVREAKNKVEAGPATKSTAKSLIPAARNDITESITNAVTEASKYIIPDEITRFMTEVLEVEEPLEDWSLKGFDDAGTSEVIGNWNEPNAPESGFTDQPPQ